MILVAAAGVTDGGGGSSSTQRDSAGLVREIRASAVLARLRAGSFFEGGGAGGPFQFNAAQLR